MSPSESDLRHALQQGADEGGVRVDADRIVAAGRARRTQRRVRVLSGAAVAVVVAGVGVGVASLSGGSDDHAGSADLGEKGSAASAAVPGAANVPGSPAGRGAAASTAPAARCPAAVPHLVTPGGGSPGQFGASAKLFTEPVASLIVCAYGSSGEAPAASLRLSGAQATTLADSLENASKTRPSGACPTIRLQSQRTLAVLATAADGSSLPAVVTTINEPACNVRVTNGTAIRFDWQPPESLRAVIANLTPIGGPVRAPVGTASGGNQGSPITH